MKEADVTQSVDKNIPAISSVGDRCCGCGACVAACPVSCLAMEADGCGFPYPRYGSGCVGCGRCARVCPALTVGDKVNAESVEWAKARDDGLRDHSSSGGVFGLLAVDVLEAGGVVYGAAFSDDCRAVRHVRVDGVAGLETVMRSKYVQSSVGESVYEGVDCDLREGRRVLFSGVACQCAAMRNYLDLRGAPSDDLLLVDVICHGVPSPRLWAEWLDWVSREAGSEVDGVNFRSKSTGWLTYSVVYYAAMEKVRSATNDHDWYMHAFLQNAALRQSCLGCPVKRRCGSDVTLGDFWGIQGIHPDVAADNMGVSTVICNTVRGGVALGAVRGSLESGPASMDEVVPGNPALVRSVEPHPKREEFLADVSSGAGIDLLMCKWQFEPSLGQKVRGKISGLKSRLMGG